VSDAHAPAWQMPPVQAVPSARLDHAVVELLGMQAWHSLAGLIKPDGKVVPPMTHPGPQLPLVQSTPPPHGVPSASDACAHVPAPSHESEVQGLPSSGQGTPLPLSTTVQPPRPSHVELCWQLVAVHACAVPPQVPVVQTSAVVHESPSSHGVPSATGGWEQPVAGTHVPATWHALGATQTTGFAPVHTPAVHVSVWVHALPSSHTVPSAPRGLEQAPVPVSHVPAAWHASSGVQMTGFEPMHTLDWHVSVCVHALLSSHDVPSGMPPQGEANT
jgi:hypothetical protein